MTVEATAKAHAVQHSPKPRTPFRDNFRVADPESALSRLVRSGGCRQSSRIPWSHLWKSKMSENAEEHISKQGDQGWPVGRRCRQSSNFPPRRFHRENATKNTMKWLRMIRNHACNSPISSPPICWRKPCRAIRRAKRLVLAYLGG